MSRILVLFLFLILSQQPFCQVYVEGYYRKNGTYVQPHYRSSPDNSPYNNYSYPGNINPYTGKEATGNPETYLKRYKNKGYSNESLINNQKNRKIYNYYSEGENYYNRKKYRIKEKNGIGLFLISVPVILGTIFILTLKK
jgi:hypothetical protein